MSKKSLEDALVLHEEKLERRRKADEKRQRKLQRQKRAERKLEEGLAPQKLALATEIFDWTGSFVQTPLYERLLSSKGQTGGDSREVWIFGAQWGHEGTYNNGHGCWSRMALREDGALSYWAGYKYMPSKPKILITGADELSRKLCHEYLEKFHDAIKTDEIYEMMRRWHFRTTI